MPSTIEIPKPTDIDKGTGGPRIMHIVKRDPATGLIIEPKIALCGKKCEEALGGRVAGGVICEACEAKARQGWGGVPNR